MNFTSPYRMSEESEVGHKDREGGIGPAPRPVLEPMPLQLHSEVSEVSEVRGRIGGETRRLLL